MFINLTPHEVQIIMENEVLAVPPSGTVARCEQSEELVGEIDGVRVTRLVMGELVGLPPASEGVTYIVSHIVLQAATQRHDLVKPGELVRNAAGDIIGCRSLSCL